MAVTAIPAETGHQMKLVGSGFLLNEQTFIIYLRLRAEQNPILPSETMPNYPGKTPSATTRRRICMPTSARSLTTRRRWRRFPR